MTTPLARRLAAEFIGTCCLLMAHIGGAVLAAVLASTLDGQATDEA